MMILSILTATGAPVAGQAGGDWEVVGAVLAAGPVVKGVMLVLLGFSVLSWAIIFTKFRQLHAARRENREFFHRFWGATDLAAARQATAHLTRSPAARLLRVLPEGGIAGPGRLLGPDPRRALQQALTDERHSLSRSLSFLATCGNTAPFIGLFGTVWGIMSAFHQIGLKGSASLATVAPGIAEALIATAAGLAAAIPAVMAYNYFLGQVRRLEGELADFAEELAALGGGPGGGGSPASASTQPSYL